MRNIYSERDLSLQKFPAYGLRLGPQWHKAAPSSIFPASSFGRFPPIDKPVAWQALVDEIDFYEISTEDELLLFANTSLLTRRIPDDPGVTLKGSLAHSLSNAFSDIKRVNDGKRRAEHIKGHPDVHTAARLLQDGYRPTGFSVSKSRLSLVRALEKAVKPLDPLSTEAVDQLAERRFQRWEQAQRRGGTPGAP
jgi:hypothetical protein